MKIGEYELQSPLINSGGLVKTFEDANQMAKAPVGAVLAGSFTLDSRIGNSPNGEQVYWRDPETRITYNSLEMPNKGLRELASSGELQRMIEVSHDLGKPFILNFAPVTDDPVIEVGDMAEQLEKAKVTNLDGIELNASCPNVITGDGSRHEILSHHPGLLGDVLAELGDISANEVPFGTLLVRISPFREAKDALEFAEVAKGSGVSVVSAFNTFPGGQPRKSNGDYRLQVKDGLGGMSGLGMTYRAEEQTKWLVFAREAVEGEFDIVGCNGVGEGYSMKDRLEIGCSAVGATTLFWEARDWGYAASLLLEDYAMLQA